MIPHLHDTLIGYATAGFSTIALWFANVAEAAVPGAGNVLQTGGTAGLIAGLTFGCISLWKLVQSLRDEIRAQRAEIRELNEEIREEWKSQSEELISVLKKLDK